MAKIVEAVMFIASGTHTRFEHLPDVGYALPLKKFFSFVLPGPWHTPSEGFSGHSVYGHSGFFSVFLKRYGAKKVRLPEVLGPSYSF